MVAAQASMRTVPSHTHTRHKRHQENTGADPCILPLRLLPSRRPLDAASSLLLPHLPRLFLPRPPRTLPDNPAPPRDTIGASASTQRQLSGSTTSTRASTTAPSLPSTVRCPQLFIGTEWSADSQSTFAGPLVVLDNVKFPAYNEVSGNVSALSPLLRDSCGE